MYTQLSIFQKGLTLISIPLLVQVVFIFVLIKAQSDGVSAQQWAVHTKEVIAKIEKTHLGLTEGYSGVRNLIFSGDTSPVEPYQNALKQVSSQIEELRMLVADNRSQQPRVQALSDRTHALLAWLAAEEQLVHSGRRDLALARIDHGIRLLSDARTSVDEILREEERLDGERVVVLRQSGAQQFWTLVGGGAAIVVSTVVLALLFLQGIIQRLAVLGDNARRFSEGRALKAPLTGQDEITEVDRAFHEMADNLNQQKQENDMFVYSVTHDLRSPLVNLLGFSEELSLSCQDLRGLFHREDMPAAVRQHGLKLMKDDIEESIHFIQTAVGRLARIIDALLRLSRAGRVEYRWQTVDLAMVVPRIIEALHDTISDKKADVAVGVLLPAWGDPTAVEQIFANLIANAVQYLDPARPGRIEVGSIDDSGVDKPAGLRVYFVRDNGLGIPAAYQPRMFTAFHRLHANVAQGEGIGLALVRRMVERHGGKIWLESSPGVGTTFFVALPARTGGEADCGAGERASVPHQP